jgi:hypothetical protein
MAKAVVEIDASTAGFDAAVASLPEKMNRAGAQVNKAGNSFTRNLGGAAMQFQDIAVQLQSGTKASIVFAQQGSQLLSAFGAGGAIAGGVIAIGGAFYTMGEDARKAFDDAKISAAAFDAELKLISAGTIPEMLAGMSKLDERVQGWTSELGNLNGAFSFGANIADVFGGPSVEERMSLAGEQLNALGTKRVELLNQILSLSDQEASIAKLRAAGEKELADEKERELKLAREIAKINTLAIPRFARDQLTANATAISEAGKPQPQSQSMFDRALGGVSSFLGSNAAPFKSALAAKLNDEASKSSANTTSLARAAFSPLRGDADISTGRGRSVNPLVQNASKQIAEMTKQTNLLKRQADALGDSNKYLGSIEKIVSKFKSTPIYN